MRSISQSFSSDSHGSSYGLFKGMARQVARDFRPIEPDASEFDKANEMARLYGEMLKSIEQQIPASTILVLGMAFKRVKVFEDWQPDSLVMIFQETSTKSSAVNEVLSKVGRTAEDVVYEIELMPRSHKITLHHYARLMWEVNSPSHYHAVLMHRYKLEQQH